MPTLIELVVAAPLAEADGVLLEYGLSLGAFLHHPTMIGASVYRLVRGILVL